MPFYESQSSIMIAMGYDEFDASYRQSLDHSATFSAVSSVVEGVLEVVTVDLGR